jgi:hypothetical protein
MTGLPDCICDVIESAVSDILEPLDFGCDSSDDGTERTLEFTAPEECIGRPVGIPDRPFPAPIGNGPHIIRVGPVPRPWIGGYILLRKLIRACPVALALLFLLPAVGLGGRRTTHHQSYLHRSYRAPHRYRGHSSYRAYRSHSHGIKRSSDARHEFMRQTGYPHGRPGYVIDHRKALACGGADEPSNMQWQTVAEGKAKDSWERKGCK